MGKEPVLPTGPIRTGEGGTELVGAEVAAEVAQAEAEAPPTLTKGKIPSLPVGLGAVATAEAEPGAGHVREGNRR